MIVIFGGTGTLGHALARIVSQDNFGPVYIVSRCELRQKDMRQEFPDFNYVIGDVTNTDWADNIPRNPKLVFNLAAMKHVDIAEDNVERCVAIDFNGVVNTYKWAKSVGAKSYIFTGTDKSVLPINAYGMAKGLAEKYLFEKARKDKGMTISVCKWPNVLGSRGSVLHYFVDSLKNNKPVNITDDRMTRFWLHIDDVADFMWDKRMETSLTEAHIPALKASKVTELAASVARVMGVEKYFLKEIGIRPGEKIHEVMRTGHDYCINSENCDQYSKADLDHLVARCLDDFDISGGLQGKYVTPVPVHIEPHEHTL